MPSRLSHPVPSLLLLGFISRWLIRDKCEDRVRRIGAIPEAGERSPETGFMSLATRRKLQTLVGTLTKVRKSWDGISTQDWPNACNSRKTWTHSDKRLSQVRERGGRGLLKDECWSFPPASEREARMDDPTPRSKKGRETECVLGGSCSQAWAPIFLYFILGPRFNWVVHCITFT